MQNSSEVFKSNFDYYQRVAHKKLSFDVYLDDLHFFMNPEKFNPIYPLY
jgi:hypothetical protein